MPTLALSTNASLASCGRNIHLEIKFTYFFCLYIGRFSLNIAHWSCTLRLYFVQKQLSNSNGWLFLTFITWYNYPWLSLHVLVWFRPVISSRPACTLKGVLCAEIIDQISYNPIWLFSKGLAPFMASSQIGFGEYKVVPFFSNIGTWFLIAHPPISELHYVTFGWKPSYMI